MRMYLHIDTFQMSTDALIHQQRAVPTHTCHVNNKRSVQAWPGMLRGVYGDRARYESTYFAPYPGYYYTGDGARRDADGYYWITGAVRKLCIPSAYALCMFPLPVVCGCILGAVVYVRCISPAVSSASFQQRNSHNKVI